ncbi:MAG: sigma-70 family RNA polymerase sigma factor, partial [Lentisphaeria bacterium]|nr:sigma-70 family RNA polymerase sigma factor [Lentisphaeria bacterium]
GEEPQGELELPDTSYSPDRLMQKAEMQNNVIRGMNSLPESLREAMVLRHVKDMPYEEIAAVLDCPVGTVKSRIARGRELLREYLTGMDGENTGENPPVKTANRKKVEMTQ